MLKLEATENNPNRQKARDLAFRVAGGSLVALVLFGLIVTALFLNSYPLHPKIEGTIQTQSLEPRFSLNTLTSSRLTPASASSVAKATIFLYPLSVSQTGQTFNLQIMIYSPSGAIVAQGSWDNLALGVYSFSTVLNAEFSQNMTYHVILRASFQPGTYIQIDANTPPT